MQFGGQFRAGGARADDRDMQLPRAHRGVLRMGAQAGIHQAAVEAHRLLRRLQRDGMVAHAGRAEIIGGAADGDDQRVVGKGLGGGDLAPFLVMGGGEKHGLRRAVEPHHLPVPEAEMVPMRLREVAELMLVRIHAAGGDLVQQGLPEMPSCAVHERDAGLPPPAQRVPEPGREFQPRRPAAGDDDAVRRGPVLVLGHGRLLRRNA